MKRKKEKTGRECDGNGENEENVVMRGWNNGKFVMDHLSGF